MYKTAAIKREMYSEFESAEQREGRTDSSRPEKTHWKKMTINKVDWIFTSQRAAEAGRSERVDGEEEEEGDSIYETSGLSQRSHHQTLWPLEQSLKEWSGGCFSSFTCDRRLNNLLTDDSPGLRYQLQTRTLHLSAEFCWIPLISTFFNHWLRLIRDICQVKPWWIQVFNCVTKFQFLLIF